MCLFSHAASNSTITSVADTERCIRIMDLSLLPLLMLSKIHISSFLHKTCCENPRLHSSIISYHYVSLWGDKVSMLTHTYPHKPLRKTKVTMCKHQADNQRMYGLVSHLVICNFRKKVWPYMTLNVLTDTRCH